MNGGSTSNRTPPHRQLPRMRLLMPHYRRDADWPKSAVITIFIVSRRLNSLARRSHAKAAHQSAISTEADLKNSLCDTNVLGLGEKPQRFFAPFSTDTALFHSAEGDP